MTVHKIHSNGKMQCHDAGLNHLEGHDEERWRSGRILDFEQKEYSDPGSFERSNLFKLLNYCT